MGTSLACARESASCMSSCVQIDVKAMIAAKRGYWAVPAIHTIELPAMSQMDVTLQLGTCTSSHMLK